MRRSAALAALLLILAPSAAAHHKPGHPGGTTSTASAASCYTASDGVREVNVANQFGTTDSAIRAAINTAQAGGCRVYFTSTTFRHSGTLTLNGLTAIGDGATSVIQADNAGQSAIILTGTNAKLKSVRLTSPTASSRLTTPESGGVQVRTATNALVDHVTVDRMGSVGIGVWRSTASIYTNTVRNTLADGIHVTGCSTADVGYNTVTNTGDDHVGVVGYLSDGCQPRAQVHHNVTNGQTWGRGITCVGCRDSQINDNAISNTRGAGILIARESFWNTYGVANVQVNRNVIRNPSYAIHSANIYVSCDGSGYAITNVTGSGNNLDRAKTGVRTGATTGCTLSGISVGWFYGN